MFQSWFASSEVKWARAAMDEIVARHPIFHDARVLTSAKKQLTEEFVGKGTEQGLAANQIAALSLFSASEQELFYGDGNFAYRGLLTFKGRKVRDACQTAITIMNDVRIFSDRDCTEISNNISEKIKKCG